VFKRRTTAEPVEVDAAELSASGKGRATPSRKDAEAARQARVKAPRGTKEAKQQARTQQAESRSARRAGLMAGDERYLPARDQGPVRAYVRDFIDCRRRVGELILPGALVVIVLGFIPAFAAYTYLAFYLVLLAVLIDAALVRIRLKRQLKIRFPDESTGGTTFYAVMRSLQIRRMRVPKPRVKIGQPL
jgi:hypothetical protein